MQPEKWGKHEHLTYRLEILIMLLFWSELKPGGIVRRSVKEVSCEIGVANGGCSYFLGLWLRGGVGWEGYCDNQVIFCCWSCLMIIGWDLSFCLYNTKCNWEELLWTRKSPIAALLLPLPHLPSRNPEECMVQTANYKIKIKTWAILTECWEATPIEVLGNGCWEPTTEPALWSLKYL